MECMDHIMTPEYIRENLEIIHQKDGGLHQIFKDKEGEVISTSYALFPGVVLIFKEVHRHSYISNWRQKPDQGLLVEFCKEGRLECEMGEECLYHATGDVILFRTDYTARNLRYPLNDFHSIAIAVKMDELSPLFYGYLDQVDLKIDSLFQKYQLDQHFFRVLKVNHQLESLFSEINDAPEMVKINYWKVKVFELLLLLFSMGTEIEEHPKYRISRAQASIAKEAHRYLMENLHEHITITDLAKMLSTSPTQLKEGFRVVYGAPIQTFVREQRLHAAARLLKQTDMKIRDVAEQFGYINVSKFSAAFQDVIGMRPVEYREQSNFKIN